MFQDTTAAAVLLVLKGTQQRFFSSLVPQVSIPRAIPLVYELDEDLIPVDNPGSNAPLSGRFLGSALELAEAFDGESVQAQLGICR